MSIVDAMRAQGLPRVAAVLYAAKRAGLLEEEPDPEWELASPMRWARQLGVHLITGEGEAWIDACLALITPRHSHDSTESKSLEASTQINLNDG